MKLRIPLRVVFYEEEGSWIAHSLEFDLLGHGPTKEAALELMTDAVGIQIEASLEYENLDNLFTPADGKFLKMFAQGTDVAIGEMRLDAIDDVEITHAVAREYREESGRTQADERLVPA